MITKFLSNANRVENMGRSNGYPVKSISETLTNGFFTVNRKWVVKYWNKAAEKLLGVSAKDIIGKNLWEKFAGVIPVEFYTVYHKSFLRDVPLHFEEYWGEMGEWFDVITYYCDDTLSVSFKTSSYPPHPEELVQQLKMLNDLYRFVTVVTNDCLWEWDLRAKELFWIDGGHKRVFGYPIENALISQNFWENCLHPDDKERVLARLNKILMEESGSLWEDEYRFKKANGDYAFVHDRGHIIYGEDKRASRMVGATHDISSKVLLENKLTKERQVKQREITHAVLTAQEKEREEIGRELHDNLSQVLAVAKMYLQMAKANKDKREIYLDKSGDFIENVIREIRRISKGLLIPPKHIIGLLDNIKNLVHDLVLVNPLKISFHENGITENELDEKLQLAIYRIVQEQMNNILKHARATRAAISLSRQDNKLILLISDNGEGCDMLKENNGVGVINIRSRTELYGGKVTIVSKPGEGYELKIVLPLSPGMIPIVKIV
ncbi:MAG: PAS domain-containing protein [Bacteroidota bacterium]|nr:PAS domain-containing protein [Bacteroidota bacterium]